jgi:hypothetical protein
MTQRMGGGLVAGPSFAVIDLGDDPDGTLRELGVRALEGHPELAAVVARL